MSASRESQRKKYEHLYSVPEFVSGTGTRYQCFYCGEPAEALDHVPPLTKVDEYRRSYGGKEFFKVPSCGECNRLLGDSLQQSLVERKEEIAYLLSQKHKKVLAFEEWDEDELAELAGALKKYVRASSNLRKIEEQRINYYEGVDSYTNHVEQLEQTL